MRQAEASRRLTLAERVLHVVFPRTCAHCREDLPLGDRGPLCAGCFSRLEWIEPLYCVRCGVPLESGAHCRDCLGKRFKCEALRAALAYGPEVQSLVIAFKYSGRRPLAEPLGAWLADRLDRYPDLRADALVPVPLHPKKLRSRGYNQSALLAEELSKRIGMPILDALEKPLSTPAQAELDRDERLTNVASAFRATADARGKTLLLVDDVGTTGATLEACAQALKAAGAERVLGYVLARQG